MKLNQFFIIEKHEYESLPTRYTIYKDKLFGLQEAIRNKIALETLNDNKDITFHLCNTKDLWTKTPEEPLVLKDEVKQNSESEDIPF